MELREYINIIFKNLRLIIVFTILSFIVTMLLTYQQTPVYESSSTYVTRLTTTQTFDAQIYGLDILSGRERITVTFCDVMASGDVRERAYQLLGIDDSIAPPDEYAVKCTVLPSSNVMSLTVQGTSTVLVQEINRAIGIAGIERCNALFQVIEVEPLDLVWLEEEPVSPNFVFNGALGVALGIIVSVAAIFLLEYLRSPQERLELLSIYDPRLNVYNFNYLMRRLGEEITRSRNQNRLLAMAMVQLVPDENYRLIEEEEDREALLRQAVNRLRDNLRDTDIIAHRGNNTFIIIMPETHEKDALRLANKLYEVLRATPVETPKHIVNYTAVIGIIENNGGMLDSQQTLDELRIALQKAHQSGPIEFMRTKSAPFTGMNEFMSEMEELGIDMMEEFDVEDTSPLPNLPDSFFETEIQDSDLEDSPNPAESESASGDVQKPKVASEDEEAGKTKKGEESKRLYDRVRRKITDSNKDDSPQ